MTLDSDLQKCFISLSAACDALNAKCTSHELEGISKLIIQSMTGPWRSFHTPDHIFLVGQGGDPIEVISALFHDMVYVQVDQGVNVNIARFIAPFIHEVNNQLTIIEDPELSDDPIFKMTLMIFGFKQGDTLMPMAGQNEFLSALLAAKVFNEILPLSLLAQIISCIEATIPFRGPDSDGISSSEKLFLRLKKVNEEFNFAWSDESIISIVERGVRVSNRDVENFSSDQSAHFLDNTWNLIPETNHDLKRVNTYTVNGYRVSLQKMDGFLNFLKAEVVFKHFHNEPSVHGFDELVGKTKHNLEVARLYLGMKLTSIAVLECIASRVGRDISVAMLMGELPVNGKPSFGLEQLLPTVANPIISSDPLEEEVLSLLELGRNFSSDYDVKNSPIATFMVKSIGFSEMRELLSKAREFFKGEKTSEQFLSCCPNELVRSITASIAHLFDTRKSLLLKT
jgi:hypothetical protein